MPTREGYQPKEEKSSRKIVPPKGGTGEVKKREEKVLKEQEMRFNEKKVLTMVTANQAIVGDVGWFANTLEHLEEVFKYGDVETIGRIHGSETDRRFEKLEGTSWGLFYPAPYELLQKLWVEKNDLKVGDRVYVGRGWKKFEKGFKYDFDIHIWQAYNVTEIFNDGIEVKIVQGVHLMPLSVEEDRVMKALRESSVREEFRMVPYFAVKKVIEEQKETVKPTEIEELTFHCRTVFTDGKGLHFTINKWREDGVFVENEFVTWKDFKKKYSVCRNKLCGGSHESRKR